jgi:hypothetical protein
VPKPVLKKVPRTRSKKLAKALEACTKKPKGPRRSSCVKQARRRFGAAPGKRKAATRRVG